MRANPVGSGCCGPLLAGGRGPITTVCSRQTGAPAAKVLLDDDSWVDGAVYKLVVRNGQQWAQVTWRRRQRDHGTLGSFPIERVRFAS